MPAQAMLAAHNASRVLSAIHYGCINRHRLGSTLGDISVVDHFEGKPVCTVDLRP